MDTLSKSYTDSISSYLVQHDQDAMDQESICSYSTQPSYTMPMVQERRTLSLYETNDSLPEPTPLPKLQMLIVAILLFSEPLTSTILFPFIYFMLKDFHLSDDEKQI
ncbi:hypothetical protein CU098_008365, partial [Rhizopus stolonifer]